MDACANAEFLLKVLDDITQSIFSSAGACPMWVVCLPLGQVKIEVEGFEIRYEG